MERYECQNELVFFCVLCVAWRTATWRIFLRERLCFVGKSKRFVYRSFSIGNKCLAQFHLDETPVVFVFPSQFKCRYIFGESQIAKEYFSKFTYLRNKWNSRMRKELSEMANSLEKLHDVCFECKKHLFNLHFFRYETNSNRMLYFILLWHISS